MGLLWLEVTHFVANQQSPLVERLARADYIRAMSEAAPNNNQLARLLYVLDLQRTKIDELEAENAALKNAIANGGDALACLQRTYLDPLTTPANKIKAAAAAIGYERPKMSLNVRIGPGILGARLEEARTPKAALVIEHEPPQAA